MESKLTIEGLEKERDFYFGKLRDIEVLAQEHEADGGEFVQKALAVLYATEVGVFKPSYESLLVFQTSLFVPRTDSLCQRTRRAASHPRRRRSTKRSRSALCRDSHHASDLLPSSTVHYTHPPCPKSSLFAKEGKEERDLVFLISDSK